MKILFIYTAEGILEEDKILVKYRYFVFALPLLFMAVLFCGCGNDNSQNSEEYVVEFECPEIINMKLGTTDSNNEIALAPLYSNIDLSQCVIEYDSNIISYDADTGIIKALKSGTTRIKATAGDKVDIIDVIVDKAVYCTSLTFNATDKILLGETAELLVNINLGYNMGLEYESLNENILTIDENGIITPKSLGYATIKVIAKTAVDNYVDSGYQTIWATKTVQVVEARTELNIEILDSSLEPVASELDENGILNYNLFSSTDKSPVYILKITSNRDFDDSCYVTESTTANDCTNTSGSSKRLFEWTSFNDVIVGSNNTYFRAFYCVDSGVDYFMESVIEIGMNYNSILNSNPIKINVYKQVEEINTTVYTDTTCQTEVTETTSAGEYILTGKTQFFFFVDLGDYSLNKINYDFYNIDCEPTENGFLVKSSGEVGSGYLIIQSTDGSNITKIIHFYNAIKNATIKVDRTNFYVTPVNGIAGVDIYYTVYNLNGDVVNNQDCYIEFLDKDGNVIELNNGEISYVDVTIGSFVIDFCKSGTYYLKIVSKLGYVSEIITVTVF